MTQAGQEEQQWRAESVPDEYSAVEPIAYSVHFNDNRPTFWFTDEQASEELAAYLNSLEQALRDARRDVAMERGNVYELQAALRDKTAAEEIGRRVVEAYLRPGNRAAVAAICDEVLDRSGALLGYVRDAALVSEEGG